MREVDFNGQIIPVRQLANVPQKAVPEDAAPVSDKQIKSIVRKVKAVIVEAKAEASHSGVDLTSESLIRVVDEAILEASDMSHQPDFPQTVEGVYLSGIYDDLIQQPSNIFDIVTRADGKSYYIPLSSGVWARCLEVLRKGLLKP